MSNGLRKVAGLLVALLCVLGSLAGVAYAQDEPPGAPDTKPLAANPDSPDTITLPDSGSTSTTGIAWSITNNGTGRAGYFNLNNTNTNNPALEARTVSTSSNATAFTAQALGTAGGTSSAAVKAVNASSNANGWGVLGQHLGSGIGVYGWASGAGGRGVYGYNPASSGAGKGVYGAARSVSGFGGYFVNLGGTSTSGGVAVMGLSAGTTATDPHGNYNLENAGGEFSGINGVIASTKAGINNGTAVIGINRSTTGGVGVRGFTSAPDSFALLGSATADRGVGVRGDASECNSGPCYGVYGYSSGNASADRYGVYGESDEYGVYGKGNQDGVHGESNGGTGVTGTGYYGLYGSGTSFGVYGSGADYGVYGTSSSSYGVYGSSGGTAVYAEGGDYGVRAAGDYALYGSGSSYGSYGNSGNIGARGHGGTYGVYGDGTNYGVYGVGGIYGVYGASGTTASVYGAAAYVGVWAEGTTYGLYAHSSGATYAVYGKNTDSTGWAGFFEGRVHANSFAAAATYTRIDDPLDSSQYLDQANVVGADMLGLKNGNAILDARGRAEITLPAWFSKVYADYRYTLTPIGAAALVYVADELKGDKFTIAGGKPGMKVSWMVAGVRQDQYAKEHPLSNVVAKASEPDGKPPVDADIKLPAVPVPPTPPAPKASSAPKAPGK